MENETKKNRNGLHNYFFYNHDLFRKAEKECAEAYLDEPNKPYYEQLTKEESYDYEVKVYETMKMIIEDRKVGFYH